MRANSKDERGLGYTQIGIWCDSGRRSLWCRITPRREAIRGEAGDQWVVAEAINIAFIELCAGREGDDAYAKVTADNSVFPELLDVLSCAEYAVEMANDADDAAWIARKAKYVVDNSWNELMSEREVADLIEQALLRGKRDPVASLEAQPPRDMNGNPDAWYDQNPAFDPYSICVDFSSINVRDYQSPVRLKLDDAEQLAIDILAAVGEARRNGAR